MKAENRGFKASSRAINYQNLESSWAERMKPRRERNAGMCKLITVEVRKREKGRGRTSEIEIGILFVILYVLHSLKRHYMGSRFHMKWLKLCHAMCPSIHKSSGCRIGFEQQIPYPDEYNAENREQNTLTHNNNNQCTGHSTLINFVLSSNVQMLYHCYSYFHCHCYRLTQGI